uniref:Uncharacterized protein n=1 Tax=Siphoviridae sp. ctWsj12 TaxID=2826363 RepID=A0A8S5NSB8_9CAUD|nr:MAG TPA: hypothetical protein [Siphoviridae sp. ctWsj12]
MLFLETSYSKIGLKVVSIQTSIKSEWRRYVERNRKDGY